MTEEARETDGGDPKIRDGGGLRGKDREALGERTGRLKVLTGEARGAGTQETRGDVQFIFQTS